MPWNPELFSEPALGRIWEDTRRRRLAVVPFFEGLLTGETGALVDSFAGEPELHHPVRGRIKGAAAFERFAVQTRDWLLEHSAAVEDVDFLLVPERGIEEAVLHLDGGRVELPVAVVSDHGEGGGIVEQRVYFSPWPLTGEHAVRPPVLQPDESIRLPDAAGELLRALAEGDVEAAVAAFEPDGYMREPGARVHRGAEELRAFYERLFSNGGGLRLEQCAATDDGRACALEYNVVGWGRTVFSPEAGLAVHVRGDGGRLAAARIYDDAAPPRVRGASSSG